MLNTSPFDCIRNIRVRKQVGKHRSHRNKKLSGIMVYSNNCLVSSYARGGDLPGTVPAEEAGCLAIVSFSGPVDNRLFHPNPTKVLRDSHRSFFTNPTR